MIIQIHSKNKHLLDILNKNPETDQGLYLKPLKEGIIVGNVVSAFQYDVLFQDKQHSYTEDKGNALDFQSYVNPLIVLNISTELFGHLLKDKIEYQAQELKWLETTRGNIDTVPCEIEVPVFHINSSWYRNGQFLLEKYFPNIELTHRVGKNFKLKVKGDTVFEAFNLLNLVALFTHLTNDDALYTYIDDSFAGKYVRVLTNLASVPYFVIYLFVKRTIRGLRLFETLKPILENYLLQYDIAAELTIDDTQQSRLGFITETIGFDLPIFDIGCGEFSYYKRFSGKGFSLPYYAVDKVADLERLGENIQSRLGKENLIFLTNLEALPKDLACNIVLSEVIEHNSLEDAKVLVAKLLQYPFEKLVISTPNASFNQFYFDEGMRHDDHHFELTELEFEQFINECIGDARNIIVDYTQVGDKLNNIQPTQIAVITKTKNHESQR